MIFARGLSVTMFSYDKFCRLRLQSVRYKRKTISEKCYFLFTFFVCTGYTLLFLCVSRRYNEEKSSTPTVWNVVGAMISIAERTM
jgi:hypothetical protein